MKKSAKIAIIISSIVMVILIILILLLNYFESLQPEEIEYPGSGLSGSIFDTQNTSYTANESLPVVHEYENIPYLLDVPESYKAVVGEGTTYKLNNSLYIYTSEFPYNTDIDYTLSQQLGKVLMLDCNDDMTICETQKEEIGYRNGFGIVYDVKNMYVSNGENSIKAVVMTYYIELPEETEDVLIGVVSTVETNEVIRQMKDVLDAELQTFRYDEEHGEDIADREAQEEKDEAAAIRQAENEEAAEERAAEKEQAAEEAELAKQTTTSDVDIELDDSYSELYLTVSWKTQNAVSNIVLISPTGESYDYLSLEKTLATFDVTGAPAGTWTARVTGVNVGSVNISMEDIGEDEEDYYTDEEVTDEESDTTEITTEE